jgi:hypothetical protein
MKSKNMSDKTFVFIWCFFPPVLWIERDRDRQTERQKDRKTRYTEIQDRQKDRKTERQKDKIDRKTR